MSKTPRPTIEILPLRSAARLDAPTEMPILIRIAAPAPQTQKPRGALNLGLVLDRSGSMSGDKLRAAKDAASFAVAQLGSRDRVAVTVYDDEVETIVASTLALDKTAITSRIGAVRSGGSTALHPGWVEGATQVAAHLQSGALNRVLLLTDGLANHGETDPRRICRDVKGAAARGVSTTALGVGRDFNEDLLQAMATAGDGNYYFIEGAADFARIFEAEMRGLMATFGQTVSLGIKARGGASCSDVLNDLEQNSLGRWKLANLVGGNTLEIAAILQIPALSERESEVCSIRLAWSAPGETERHILRASLLLRGVSDAEWERLPCDERVSDAVSLLQGARMRDEVHDFLAHGDIAGARGASGRLREHYAASPLRAGVAEEEMAALEELDSHLDEGDALLAAKKSKMRTYQQRRSR